MMRYKARWIPDHPGQFVEGNVVKASDKKELEQRRQKVIQMENIRPRHINDRAARRRAAAKRRKRARTNRLALQGLSMTLMMVQISMLDGAGFVQMIVLLAGIMACSGIMLLMDLTERKER